MTPVVLSDTVNLSHSIETLDKNNKASIVSPPMLRRYREQVRRADVAHDKSDPILRIHFETTSSLPEATMEFEDAHQASAETPFPGSSEGQKRQYVSFPNSSEDQVAQNPFVSFPDSLEEQTGEDSFIHFPSSSEEHITQDPFLPLLSNPMAETVSARGHDWMNEPIPDPETGAKEEFANHEREYVAKKRTGEATREDHINFKRAEKEEKCRLKRIAAERSSSPVESEGLFVPEAPAEVLRKRYHAEVSDAIEDDCDFEPSSFYMKPSSKRTKVSPTQCDEQEVLRRAMLVGIGEETLKEKRNDRAKAQKEKKKKKKKKKIPQMKETRVAKHDKKTGGKPGKGKSGKLDKNSRTKSAKPGLFDLDSIFSGNVYADANANLEKPSAVIMTETKKADALDQLLSSVPLEDRKIASKERRTVRQATVKLGRRMVTADGNGGWLVKGMRSSLKHYQVLASSFMKERELGEDKPFGGLLADAMGLGKTVTMLGCMVANRPPPEAPHKTTLIVCPASLIKQWEDEILLHVEPGVLGNIIILDTSSKLKGSGAAMVLPKADIIITSFDTVRKQYPKFKPPSELTSYEAKIQWWELYFLKEAGILFRIQFYRIVLDECQFIKNWKSQTSIAACSLQGRHRWLISGSPIMNSTEELYPSLRFLEVKYTGDLDIFKANFCDKENNLICNERIHSFLKQFMVRRSHTDTLFNAPLVVLPRNHERTLEIEFSKAERILYGIVRKRYINRINQFQNEGSAECNKMNILTMLMRLRQFTAHPFLIQDTIEEILEGEDAEALWAAGEGLEMLVQMRKLLAERSNPGSETEATSSSIEAEDIELERSRPWVFKFRTILRALVRSSSWNELQERTLCCRCADIPDDPWVTSCMHLYCKDCLSAMALEAMELDQNRVTCLACDEVYVESRSCTGLKELAFDNVPESSKGETLTRSRARKAPGDDTRWMTMGGYVLPSSKTAAFVAQVADWLESEPDSKIIVFTQWELMIKILGRACTERGWGYCTYYGKMSRNARDQSIEELKTNKRCRIMLMTLKTGGVGLNLTFANRVICIDSAEQQAFCRVFRIGQKKETWITRFVVKHTVDVKLQQMQDIKRKLIAEAMGDEDGKRERQMNLHELMRLFGPVEEDSDGKEFIFVDTGGQ